MSTNKILNHINLSAKPYVIYKTSNGFDLFTDFSKKIILSNNNVTNFLESISSNKKKVKKTDLYIGFFGYELLNNLIDIKLPKQKDFNFPKGIFYKPEKKIKLSNNLNRFERDFVSGSFKININKKSYTKKL